MDLRQLECFVAVGEELSFARAADRLLYTVSNVSQHVRHLERELGLPLLDRTTRRVGLTPEGRTLLDEARHVLDAADRLRAAAHQASSGGAGSVLGLFSAGATDLVSTLLRGVKEARPDADVRFEFRVTSLIHEALEQGTASIGIARSTAPGLSSLTLTSHPTNIVVLPEQHRLASRAAVSVADLDGEDLVLIERHINPGVHDEVVEYFHQLGVAPSYRTFAVNTVEQTIELVAMGHGVTLSTEYDTKRYARKGSVLRPLTGPAILTEHYLLWRADGSSPLVKAIVAVARASLPLFSAL